MEIKFKGIDISAWQSTPNFEKVKAAGVQFVIARAGYGKNNIDKQFHRNAAECNRLGIPLGVYWFSYATNAQEAAQEARYCLEAVKPYRLEYPGPMGAAERSRPRVATRRARRSPSRTPSTRRFMPINTMRSSSPTARNRPRAS